jgi:hypothetical protein
LNVSVKSKYWQQTQKYGIKIPKSVKHALELDQKNGDSQWWEASMTEMANARVVFQVFDKERKHYHQDIKQINIM